MIILEVSNRGGIGQLHVEGLERGFFLGSRVAIILDFISLMVGEVVFIFKIVV